MDHNDYFGPIFALIVGVVCVIYRRQVAEIAIHEHEVLFGRRWPQRSFEVPFFIGGLLFIAWAVFMIVGNFVFSH